MTPAQRLIETASGEIGYLEKSKTAYDADHSILDSFTDGVGEDNYTKYARDQWQEHYFNSSKQGIAWCAVFVGWCFLRTFGKGVALRLQCQPSSGNAGAGCAAAAKYYKTKGRFSHPGPKLEIRYFSGQWTQRRTQGSLWQCLETR